MTKKKVNQEQTSKVSYIRQLVALALAEDASDNDLTTKALFKPKEKAKAIIVANEPGIIAGLEVIKELFAQVDKEVKLQLLLADGDAVKTGQKVVELEGRARSILAAERTALNFLQRLSGIATLTNKFVKAVSGYKAKIYDTRKTTPGLRWLEKYAVKVGGGENHRLNLAAGILIKDNHRQKKSIQEAVALVKEKYPKLQVEVEVENLEQLKQALAVGADVIMLDNMSIKAMQAAVKINQGQAVLEASGGINLTNVAKVAATGVDRISLGALTQAAKALDFTLEFIA